MKKAKKTAVVFGYGDMGIRCFKTIVNEGVDIQLVVTHQDNPSEKIWYGSLQKTAEDYGIQNATPETSQIGEIKKIIENIKPNFIFSFYYRHMIPMDILNLASEGAFNMHGSLLPKYRGRAPTNWAILKGEKETGATLHLMTEKADAGDIIDSFSVPILDNDTAHDVFLKTLTAAELILKKQTNQLLNGTYPRHPNNIKQGSYFGRRTSKDGEIKKEMSTLEIHNLIRAVAPPFPGAYFKLPQNDLYIFQTLLEKTSAQAPLKMQIYKENNRYYLQKEAEVRLQILDCSFDASQIISARTFFENNSIQLPWSLS